MVTEGSVRAYDQKRVSTAESEGFTHLIIFAMSALGALSHNSDQSELLGFEKGKLLAGAFWGDEARHETGITPPAAGPGISSEVSSGPRPSGAFYWQGCWFGFPAAETWLQQGVR